YYERVVVSAVVDELESRPGQLPIALGRRGARDASNTADFWPEILLVDPAPLGLRPALLRDQPLPARFEKPISSKRDAGLMVPSWSGMERAFCVPASLRDRVLAALEAEVRQQPHLGAWRPCEIAPLTSLWSSGVPGLVPVGK